MEGGIILPVVLYVLGSVAAIMFGFNALKKGTTLLISSSSTENTTQQIESGEGKAKRLEDKGHINGNGQNTSQAANGNGNANVTPELSYSRIPDMRGADYGSMSESMSSMQGGRGAVPAGAGGATVVVGAVNAVASLHSGMVNNNFVAASQRIGLLDQKGSVIKNEKVKGVKAINQMNSNIRNTFNRGRAVLTQGDVAQNTINDGRVHIPHLTIKGVSKANKMFIKKFSVPKETRMKVEHLNAMRNGNEMRKCSKCKSNYRWSKRLKSNKWNSRNY